jgi:hypothetical protein
LTVSNCACSNEPVASQIGDRSALGLIHLCDEQPSRALDIEFGDGLMLCKIVAQRPSVPTVIQDGIQLYSAAGLVGDDGLRSMRASSDAPGALRSRSRTAEPHQVENGAPNGERQ